jgi:hypothetical protein
MHFHVVALKETAVISITKRNVLYLAGCSDSEFIGLRDDKTLAA